MGALGGALLDVRIGWLGIVAGTLIAAVLRRPALILVGVLGVGVMSGAFAQQRREATFETSLPQGRGDLVGVAATDSVPYGNSARFVVSPTSWTSSRPESNQQPWHGPAVVVIGDEVNVVAGDLVVVSGLIRPMPGLVRGDPVAGRISASSVSVLSRGGSPVLDAGNAFRRLVQERTAMLGDTAESALLRGFLIGDTTDLGSADLDSLRRAGLTHFVAVSGSNVALVLGAWWLVIGPLGAGNRIRAITGLAVLAVFVVATRWESSVIRAATMAGLVLGGRAVGVAIDAWAALGGAVTILLVASGDLAYDIGFQLSVVATAGVLFGAGMWRDRRPRLVFGLLAATLSAQAAVAPLLLLHFGSVPLLSPIANLAAAPLVTLATALSGAGVLTGWRLLLDLAGAVAGAVLETARVAGEWPQLNAAAATGVAGVLAVAWATRRRWVLFATLITIAVLATMPSRPPPDPTLVALDIGQGDAVLLLDPSGAVVLMDGGRDPLVLRDALRRHGVDRIDLVVASHGDADHVGGLVDIVDFVQVGYVWYPEYAETGDLLDELITDAGQAGIPVDAVRAGDGATVGEFAIEVLGPLRRYATDNDGSVVLRATAGMRSALLPGDLGAVGQSDLGPVDTDVMLVPHHGAATTDLEWLADTVGEIAIVSVGPNTYGHPHPDVIDTLQQAGAEVLTTWDRGDISISLR